MSLVERARTLAQDLPSHRASHDAEKRLDPTVIQRLRDEGFLTSMVPHELGGAELAPATYVEMLEALAVGDAATAWCVMTASTSTLLGAYLPRETSASIWANQSPFLAGVFAPMGKLESGKLSGRWSYSSGSRHADWFAVGAMADKRHVVCFVRPAEGRIVENWDTLGLAGTGSHDFVVEGVQIAPTHVASVFGRTPWTDSPLYRVPLFGLLAIGIAACSLGIARGALGDVAAKLAGEVPSTVLEHYAALRAELDASRAFLLATSRMAFERASLGAVDAATRGELRLAATSVAERCAEVTRGAFRLGGGASMRSESPLGRALRDVETLLTHRMVSNRVLPAAARALLGIGEPPIDL